MVLASSGGDCHDVTKLPEAGIEPARPCGHGILNPNPTLETQALANEGAQNGAAAPVDPNLRAVNEAWEHLPDHIKATILTLVNSTKEATK
jgi:hypothetical protein